MPTLLLSTMCLPAAPAIAKAARDSRWRAYALDETPNPRTRDQLVYYGGSDVAMDIASRFNLALLEPPFDLLARLPLSFRQRAVEFSRFRDLLRLKAPTFVKPADALHKAFDAGIYRDGRDIRGWQRVDPESPVLVAEPVEWLAEYRCFILEGKVVASSPYLSFGRPVWQPYGQRGHVSQTSANVLAFCDRLFAQSQLAFPPAFVMDVGLIEDRGWAVVEFNPAWCSGLLGANPQPVLAVLQRGCQGKDRVSQADRRWEIRRGRGAGTG